MKKLTAREVLDDTVKFYSEDPLRRAVLSDAREDCVYTDHEGNHCAVGRWLQEEYQDYNWVYNQDSVNELFDDGHTDRDFLVPEVRDLPFDFWVELQCLHDNVCNWDEEGLSSIGKKTVIRLEEFVKTIDKGENNG